MLCTTCHLLRGEAESFVKQARGCELTVSNVTELVRISAINDLVKLTCSSFAGRLGKLRAAASGHELMSIYLSDTFSSHAVCKFFVS